MTTCHEQPRETVSRASGLNLAAQRQQKGITLEQIAAATRIGVYFLQAIEAEKFRALPGGVYNTSYIRQYARAASLDENHLIEHYLLVTEPKPSLIPPHVFPGERAVRSFLELVRRPRRSRHPA